MFSIMTCQIASKTEMGVFLKRILRKYLFMCNQLHSLPQVQEDDEVNTWTKPLQYLCTTEGT